MDLYKKMVCIKKSRPYVNKKSLKKTYVKGTTLHKPFKTRKIRQINLENWALYNRIHKVKSNYSTKKWKKQHKYNTYLKRNVC